MKIKDLLRKVKLFDLYSGTLTDYQREITNSYLSYNASLAEIAFNYNTTKQAVGDLLRRTFKNLEDMEQKIGLLRKLETVSLKMDNISKRYGGDKETELNQELKALIKILED